MTPLQTKVDLAYYAVRSDHAKTKTEREVAKLLYNALVKSIPYRR